MKQLLLVGAEPVHLHALASLGRERAAGTRVTLVAPQARSMPESAIPDLMSGRLSNDDICLDLAGLARAGRAEFVAASPVGLDLDSRELRLHDGRRLQFDALSLGLTPTIDRDEIAGAREHALFLRPLEVFAVLWQRLVDIAEEVAVLELDEGDRRRMRSLVVVGGDAFAVGVAHAAARRLSGQTRVTLVTHTDGLLPGAPPALVSCAEESLRRMGITVLVDRCVAVDSQSVQLAQGTRVACDAPLVAITPRPPRWIAESGLEVDDVGRLLVDSTLHSVSHAGVFACGTLATADAAIDERDVHAARVAGQVLATNLRRFIGGGERLARGPSSPSWRFISVDRYRAIAWRGARVLEGWLAEAMRRRALRTARRELVQPRT